MEMPSQFEQDIAEAYCLRRPLPRPNTTVKKCVMCACIFEGIALLLATVVYLAFGWLGTFSFFEPLLAFRTAHPVLTAFLCWLGVNLVEGLLCSRMILIGMVRLYQHYADEEIRRRCICMPTCSEYTILVIQRYGPVVGLIKAFIRLKYRCRGNVYSIDYPYPKYMPHFTKRK